jgi:hypothetical protein
MGSAPFALFPRIIRAPVFGRAYSAAPTLFHADIYGILRKLEGEGPKYVAGMRIYRQSGAILRDLTRARNCFDAVAVVLTRPRNQDGRACNSAKPAPQTILNNQ